MRLDRLTLLGQRPCDVGAVNADGEGVVNVVGESKGGGVAVVPLVYNLHKIN